MTTLGLGLMNCEKSLNNVGDGSAKLWIGDSKC